jgi:tetratricopeptide (TPR) repeat protein
MIQNQIDRARELPARSKLMVRQAAIHGDGLGDRERAQHLYETAVELDPSNVAAAGPLAMLFVEQQEWARAWPLFELQLRQDVARTEEDAKRLYFNAGVTAEQLGFDEQALSLYERVLEYEMGHLGSQRGLARLYTRLGREEDAYQTYVDILAEHRSSMPPLEAAECYEKAGRIKLEQGDLGEARLMFLNALEIVPDSESVLRQMIVVVEESGDTQSAVDYKQRLLPLTSDDLERFKLLVELGDGYLDVGDTPQAEKCYRDAVQLDPGSKVVLHKLLNIFTSTGNWRRATEVLGQLARMEEDPDRHAKLCFTIAAIFRDELGELENAVEFYNKALDARFEYLEAFEAIDHLLTSARDWKALEQNYRRMLQRVEEAGDTASVELKVTLLKNLGEIYRSRLQRYDDAIAAYRLAAQYAPDDEVLLTILTELVEHAANSPEEVVEAHQRLIAVSPFRIESYRALFKAYLEARQFDEAWCMSSALSLLQKATPEEEGYYAKYLPKTVREARPNLTGAHWKERIYHEQLDRNITTLFEILGVHLRGHLTRDHRDWGVHKKKDRIDLSEAMPVTKMLNYATAELGVSEIQLFQKSGHVGLVNMNVEPQAVLAGGDMFQNTRPLELAFQVAKAVTLMRPEFYLASAFPSTDLLKVFFFAAASAATGQVIGDGDTKLITEYAQEIRDLPPQVQEQVRRAVSAVFESGRNPDLSAWLRAVDHTASRAGLLLCGDLRTAVSCIKLEADRGQALSKADMKERVRELVLFNISNAHYALRRDLGLALQATK